MTPFKNLHQSLTWSLILIAVLSVSMVGSFWLYQEYNNFNSDISNLQQENLADHKREIKHEVDQVMDYIEYKRAAKEYQLKENIKSRVNEAVTVANSLYATYRNKTSDEDIKELIKENLRSLHFNQGRGYYFIYDMEGNNILLPFSPELEGKNLWNLQDSKGGHTIQRAVKLVSTQGEGFLHWYWYKPGEKKQMSEKIGFFKRLEPFGWWIGTGEYIEDYKRDIQQEALARINKLRYGRDGYIFVYDFDAITLAHYKPKNIGIDRWNYQDANGVYVVRDLISLSQEEGGGFLPYVGTIRPTTDLPAPKIGYARSVKDWHWMVGTGVYVDTINDILQAKREVLKTKIKGNLLTILFFLCISLLVVAVISKLITNKIDNNFKTFTRFFKQAATDSIEIDDQTVHFSEFKWLAQSANQMIEERNTVESSLEKLREQLMQSRKMEALGVLAGGVAHDLNNVLSALVSYPDLILKSLPADSPQRKFILTIKDSGLKAAAIVQDLLTLARRGVAKRIPLNLNTVIEDYIQSPEHTKILADYPDVTFITSLSPDLLPICGSQIHLQKTLMNLVTNAAEAQPNGGSIHITTENRYMDQVSDDIAKLPQGEGEYTVLMVEDQGLGISQADLEHLFEPFFTKKHMGKSGTGLGMAVVWGTVQDHGGLINVSTREGKGTLFEIYFPATRDAFIAPKETEQVDQYLGRGKSVLIVDDLEEQRHLAEAILRQLGYTTNAVASGEEAVEYLKHQEVDLVVLDIIMEPGMDGLETYKQITALHPEQKAIIASGYAETDSVKSAIKLGVSQYIKKPYTINTIGKAIKQELHSSSL